MPERRISNVKFYYVLLILCSGNSVSFLYSNGYEHNCYLQRYLEVHKKTRLISWFYSSKTGEGLGNIKFSYKIPSCCVLGGDWFWLFQSIPSILFQAHLSSSVKSLGIFPRKRDLFTWSFLICRWWTNQWQMWIFFI